MINQTYHSWSSEGTGNEYELCKTVLTSRGETETFYSLRISDSMQTLYTLMLGGGITKIEVRHSADPISQKSGYILSIGDAILNMFPPEELDGVAVFMGVEVIHTEDLLDDK